MQARSPERMIDALLIGVDLGPNLSIIGPFAMVLWLVPIRREGENVTFMHFLVVDVVVMVSALAVRIMSGRRSSTPRML
jgi:arsenical pump membrane protein